MKARVGSRWMRSRDTCTQCRIRKVRCDGRPGMCCNCERLKFECSFSRAGDGTLSNAVVVQPERRRVIQACQDCRVHKVRCTGERPECANCSRRGRRCVYPPTTRTLLAFRPSDGSPGNDGGATEQSSSTSAPSTPYTLLRAPSVPSSNASSSVDQTAKGSPALSPSDSTAQSSSIMPNVLPSKKEMLQLIEDYFHHIHPLPSHSFLHEPSIMQLFVEDALEECLLLAICATAAQQLRRLQYFPDASMRWAQRAETLIWQQLETPSVPKLQALVLTIRFFIECRNFKRAFMLSGITARVAAALRLNYERKNFSPVARETRRRLMWAVRILDGAFSVGLPELELFPSENIYVYLPCPEEVYLFSQVTERSESSNSTPPPIAPMGEPGELGLYATCVRIHLLRRDTVRLARQLALAEHPMPQLNSLINELHNRLREVRVGHERLTPYSPAVLAGYVDSRWLPRYIMSHLSWHHCVHNLYRVFLDGFPEAASEPVLNVIEPEYKLFAEKICVENSLGILDIIDEVGRQVTNRRIIDFDTAVCGYHACRLILFSGSKGNDALGVTMPAAVERTRNCLNILRRMFPHLPLVTQIILDLERLLEEYEVGNPDLNSQVPSNMDHAYPEDVTQLYQAPITHQKLAIHSVLHQANFLDESYDTRPMAEGSKDASASSVQPDPMWPVGGGAEEGGVLRYFPIGVGGPGSLDCGGVGFDDSRFSLPFGYYEG